MSVQQEEAGTGAGLSVRAVHSYDKVIDPTGAAKDINTAGTTQNREFATLTTTVETATWSTGVTEITVTIYSTALGDAGTLASAVLAFDAPSDLVETTWLTAGDATATNSNRAVVVTGTPRTFQFTSAITRLGAKAEFLGTTTPETIAMIVEAA